MRIIPMLTSKRRREALEALEKSDITVSRCYECGVVVPEEWVVYRRSLREIVSAPPGSNDVAVPDRPAYPEGT